jgi:hypothetical protein
MSTPPVLNSKQIERRILRRRTVSIEHPTSNVQCGFAFLSLNEKVMSAED